MSKYLIVIYLLSIHISLSMHYEKKVFQNPIKKIKKKKLTFLDFLPMDVQCIIGNFLMRLLCLDENYYYDKFIFAKTIAQINDKKTDYPHRGDPIISKRYYTQLHANGRSVWKEQYVVQVFNYFPNVFIKSNLYGDTIVKKSTNKKKVCCVSYENGGLWNVKNAFSPYHTVMAMVNGKIVQLRSTQTGELLHVLNHDEVIEKVAFSIDGTSVRTVTIDEQRMKWYFSDKFIADMPYNYFFTWRQAYLINRIILANKQFNNYCISKNSLNYKVYCSLPEEIKTRFLEKYFNIKIANFSKSKK